MTEASGPEISPEQFDRALNVLCAYEPGQGFSLGDLLVALCLLLGAKLPDTIVIENALCLLREQGETLG